MDDNTGFTEQQAHGTLESIRTRLEAFAEGFERLARGRKQHAAAKEFSDFVNDYHPLSMADLNRLIGLGHSLDVYADMFKQLGGRAEFRELVRELEQFAGECDAVHDRWSRSGAPDVQHPTITRPVVDELLRDIQEMTSRQFVYEDPWHGFVPIREGDKLEDYHLGPLLPFAELGRRDKADVLDSFISWDHYRKQGLILQRPGR
jgi:hypothetical protein